LESALVMLAVIGNDWSGPRPDGAARIFDHDDPVRVEVETAFANRRAVIPVLVNGAAMPAEAGLPHSLRPLPYLHAIELRSGDAFASDLEHLFGAIDQLTAKFWALYASIYLALPFVLMLFSQYLILFKFDTDPLYLRFAVAAIAAALGVGLCFQIGFRAVAAAATAAAVAVAATLGMLTINTALGNPSAPFDVRDIAPSITRDWQEVVEYIAIITAATLATNVLAWAVRDRRGRPRADRQEP
jgi:hypothetical protein